MQEEIQMIKEALEMCKFDLKYAKIIHYIFLFFTPVFYLVIGTAILTSTPLSFFAIIGIVGCAAMIYWNTNRHNNLVLDIEDLEYALEELTKE